MPLAPHTYHVYILKCANGAYYIGHTANLRERIAVHNQGKGAAYTRRNGPVELVYSELADSQPSAMRRERQIKGWTRRKKEALIAGDVRTLHQAARRRTPESRSPRPDCAPA